LLHEASYESRRARQRFFGDVAGHLKRKRARPVKDAP
jgi:hypothetical protein